MADDNNGEVVTVSDNNGMCGFYTLPIRPYLWIDKFMKPLEYKQAAKSKAQNQLGH